MKKWKKVPDELKLKWELKLTNKIRLIVYYENFLNDDENCYDIGIWINGFELRLSDDDVGYKTLKEAKAGIKFEFQKRANWFDDAEVVLNKELIIDIDK